MTEMRVLSSACGDLAAWLRGNPDPAPDRLRRAAEFVREAGRQGTQHRRAGRRDRSAPALALRLRLALRLASISPFSVGKHPCSPGGRGRPVLTVRRLPNAS